MSTGSEVTLQGESSTLIALQRVRKVPPPRVVNGRSIRVAKVPPYLSTTEMTTYIFPKLGLLLRAIITSAGNRHRITDFGLDKDLDDLEADSHCEG